MRHNHTTLRVLVALLSGLVLTASFLPAANAQGNVTVEADTDVGFLYWEDNFLVMTYSAMTFCDSPFVQPTAPGTITTGRDGTVTTKTNAVVPASVYEIPEIGPERIDLVFEWLFDNCETEAYAQGDARLRSLQRVGDSGVLLAQNRLRGTFTRPDGETVRVRTFAKVRIDAATGGLISLDKLSVNIR